MKNVEEMKTVEEMKAYIREHNLIGQVQEFLELGSDPEGAIEYVYDSHVLTKEEFVEKYMK